MRYSPVIAVLMLLLLFTDSGEARPTARTMPAEAQTLAVSVPENDGVTLRLYRVGDNGAMKTLSRARLAGTEGRVNWPSLSFSADGKYAYACCYLDGGTQGVRQYRLTADGSLVPLAVPPAAVGYDAAAITLAPDGRTAYVICRAGVWQFRRGVRGELTPLLTPHLSIGEPTQHHNLRREITKPGDKCFTFEVENNDTVSPLQIVFDATGHYVYALCHQYYYKGTEIITSFGSHGGGTETDTTRFIVRYRVLADGELVSSTPRMPLPITTSSVVLSPSQPILYAVDGQAKTVTPYRLSPDGAAPLDPPSVVPGERICLDALGHYAYAATNGAIAQYRVRDDGSLMPLVPASVTVPTIGILNAPASLVGQLRLDRTGRLLFVRYVTNDMVTAVASYAIRRTGLLASQPTAIVPVSGDYGFGEMTVLSNLPQSVQAEPQSLASPPELAERHRAPTNEFAYVLNSHEQTISQYQVTQTGALRPLSPPIAAAGGPPDCDWPGHMSTDPSGRHLYVTAGVENEVLQFRVSDGGTLVPLSPPVVRFPFGVVPDGVAINPTGRFAYVVDRNNAKLYAFSIGQDGTLVPVPANDLPFSQGFRGLFVNPAAGMLLVLHDNNYLDSYRIGADGHLKYLARCQPNLSQPFAFDPTGKFAFYGDGGSQVWQFVVGPDGTLRENTPRAVPADEEPGAVAVTPDGRFVYAANAGDFRGDGSISCYRLDHAGHLLPLQPALLFDQTSPAYLTVDPSGRYLYALDSHYHFSSDFHYPYSPGLIRQYGIAPDGTLKPLSPAEVKSGVGASAIVMVRHLQNRGRASRDRRGRGGGRTMNVRTPTMRSTVMI